MSHSAFNLKQRVLTMNVRPEYIESYDYHAMMMYSPELDEIQKLGHELLMAKIDLAHMESMLRFYKAMYEKSIESYPTQC